MKLLDPLQGYKITSQILFLQLAFALALGVCLARDEFDYSNRDTAIGVMFVVHITSYALEYIKILTGICGRKLGVLKFTINFFNCALYQAAIFYAQVKYLNSTYDDKANATSDPELIRKNINSQQWLMLEISFYYMTVILTILFLVLQHFFKLEIPTHIDEFPIVEAIFSMHGKSSVIVDKQDKAELETNGSPDQQQDGNDDENEGFKKQKTISKNVSKRSFWHKDKQNQDFLSLINKYLQEYLFIALVFSISVYVLVKGEETPEGKMSFKYSVIILAVLFFISLLHTVVDLFTKISFPVWYDKSKYAIYALIILDILFMSVQTAILDKYEDLIRYWILIFLFIVFAFIIAYLTNWAAVKWGNEEEFFTQKEKLKKRTLIHHFMNSVSLNVDIYAITFVSFQRLDAALPRVDEQANQQPLIQQADEDEESNDGDENNEIVHNTDAEANKNFSNSAFIFLIQALLVYLVLDQFKKETTNTDVTFEILLTRILCAALLHMQLEGELRQSLQMLNYARLMVFHSKYRIPMIIISLMQFLGAIGTEVINIFLICQQDSVQNVIMNFIALGVIAEIDNIYAGTLYNNSSKKLIEDNDEKVNLQINDKKPVRSYYSKRFRLSTLVHGVLRLFYETYYYYFMPFSVIVITFFSDLIDEKPLY
ncbi:UNKNOWN [Stylonychia lemnae]|uniref:Uncharacterized protein n=1 Tax=Stylonychia lemnae TaxID=5949 RepID=A0A077ZY63_STYLE|nr:UNKNOWN [Stylonychia lemnae]|eukprot:CDW74572.1 UNKNOWN [Stylonychia lemnae]